MILLALSDQVSVPSIKDSGLGGRPMIILSKINKGGIIDNSSRGLVSIGLGFFNSTSQLKHWDMTSFCMQ